MPSLSAAVLKALMSLSNLSARTLFLDMSYPSPQFKNFCPAPFKLVSFRVLMSDIFLVNTTHSNDGFLALSNMIPIPF